MHHKFSPARAPRTHSGESFASWNPPLCILPGVVVQLFSFRSVEYKSDSRNLTALADIIQGEFRNYYQKWWKFTDCKFFTTYLNNLFANIWQRDLFKNPSIVCHCFY
jgi:hypothetical protein